MSDLLLKSTLALFASLIFCISTAHAEPSRAELQEVVDQYAEKRNFSGTVLIARGGQILLESSYAEADIAWSVPNIPQAKYRIGSLSKPFLATLVMSLSQESALSLDGTLGEYLPDLYGDTPASSITVAQLLSHTSGLQDLPGNFNDPWFQTTARLTFEPRQFAAEWIKPVLLEEPGTKWRYNNAGFVLLGIIVEEVSGQSYEALLQEHIFSPAGMINSGVYSEDAVLPLLATGYARSNEGNLVQPIQVDSSIFFSAAGIYSNARDIFRFDQALYSPEILSAESRHTMLTKKTEFAYGYGWGIEQWPLGGGDLLDVFHHTGSIPGYQSFYIRSETNQDCVIILNNTNNGSVVIEMGRNLMVMLNNGVAPSVLRSLDDFLIPIAYRDGTDAMIAAINGLGKEQDGSLSEYGASERAINRLGYKFLNRERVEDAIAVLSWNTELYPESANTHDSLGEAFRAAGKTDEAIQSYERAIAIEPDSESAATALAELRLDR